MTNEQSRTVSTSELTGLARVDALRVAYQKMGSKRLAPDEVDLLLSATSERSFRSPHYDRYERRRKVREWQDSSGTRWSK